MSYSRIKVWIAAEILSASDLNNEHNGHIVNENDLDTRLISEISARSALEIEHDDFYAACWNAVSSEIAANRVSNNSMKDDSVGFAEIKSECDDPVAGTAGFRSLGTTSVKACAGNDARLSDSRPIANASISQTKLKTSTGSQSGVADGLTGYNITMSAYSFSPNIYGEAGHFVLRASPTNSADQVGRFRVVNKATGTANYNIRWRYVTTSGEIHWVFILRKKDTKNIVWIWQAPDHPCFGSRKPLLTPHPFLGTYDKTKHEIIVINPTNREIEQMELETIVDDETKPDKDLLEVITENYEIDENSSPAWPLIPVTVGLPKHVKDKKGRKVLVDYRFMGKDIVVEPIKKVIPKPSYIKVKKLRQKN